MEINISKLNDHIKSFEDLIQNYEDESLNLYHTLKDSSIYWEDERSNLFFEYIEKDRKNIIASIENLKELKKLYILISGKYKEIGEKITYNLEAKNSIDKKFNNLLSNIANVNQKYKNLEGKLEQFEKQSIIEEKQNIKKCQNELENLRNKVKDTIDKLEDLERVVLRKLNQMNLSVVKENELSDII